MVSDKSELGFVVPPGFPDFPIRLSGGCQYPIHLIERIAQKEIKENKNPVNVEVTIILSDTEKIKVLIEERLKEDW